MRIAVSGSHRVGKSTLIDALAAQLPRYLAVEEPYHAMVEDGYSFSHPPDVEDFEAQLAQSIRDLSETGEDALFDRSPADFLAYLASIPGADGHPPTSLLERALAALETLDLIVYVPIEEPDRIAWSPSDDPDGSRGWVDRNLRELLMNGDLAVGVVEVTGPVSERVAAVLRYRSGR